MGFSKPLFFYFPLFEGWTPSLLIFQSFCLILFVSAVVTTERCEPRVLEENPPDPYYDVSDITKSAARQLADYLITKPPHSEIRQKANDIAIEALQNDDGILAVAVAAPSLKLAVVQFRDHVENGTNRTYLSTYWRELGEAWNRSDGAQFWGAPFRDCGPLVGRWLWPFSATIQIPTMK